MILVRNTFRVKFGRMKEALALMKESLARAPAQTARPRLLTDLTGDFYTLVLEFEYGSLADADRELTETVRTPGFQETYQKFAAVVDAGRREIFTIVA
jgi:hypothetical protein